MKLAVLLTALVAVVLSAALPARAIPAGMSSHWFYNRTGVCVWVTVDTSTWVTSWKNRAAKFLEPGKEHEFIIDKTTHLKMRAEPRHTAACTGPRSADIDITESSSSPMSMVGNSETTFFRSGGSYHLRWGK
jgi:hypothetical protein